MKSRLCQIMNRAYDNLGQVTSGKRCWQDGTPGTGQQFEHAFDDIDNRRTVDRGGDHEWIPNIGTLLERIPSLRDAVRRVQYSADYLLGPI